MLHITSHLDISPWSKFLPLLSLFLGYSFSYTLSNGNIIGYSVIFINIITKTKSIQTDQKLKIKIFWINIRIHIYTDKTK